MEENIAVCKKNDIKKALKIGFLTVGTYLMSYVLRNLLSVLSPHMIKSGIFTAEFIGTLVSVYMFVYAAGQLINGFAGDRIRPKYMVFSGLFLSGSSFFIFPLAASDALRIGLFALAALGLSMLRGPLVKVIAENVAEKYARICCVFLSFVGAAGPLISGVLAMIFNWTGAFLAGGIFSIGVAVLSFVLLTSFEKKGLTASCTAEKKRLGIKDILSVFLLRNFAVYMCIGAVGEIAYTSISFWLPTYMTEYLKFTPDTSVAVFSAITLVRSFSPFLCLFFIRLFNENAMKMVRCLFMFAGMIYIVMCFVKHPWANILLFMLALVATSICASTVWNIYIPGLGKSGKVSGANGIFDCSGYVFAALSNVLFVNLMGNIGWGGLTVVWAIIAFLGAASTILKSRVKEEN